jgi:hypothetical protein
MDIFRRKKFDEAMFAKNRAFAIRVGQYQSSDIKEAYFDYGYIKGDTYKPGGTCAGSGKIVFTSIITTFNKLDKVYPEIGLLVDGTYEWVKMGEYFINDIEIDRNRNTTRLDLMDGMFKLNREHVTDLTYPVEIRQVIKEICLKTGIVLANENMDLTSMNYRIDKIPKEKKMTFRDVLSLASQMLGMSCFFNREGKLEIKELTDSGITITADSYFMHGLTKSEIEYQIAGITCKKDKETLTVGMRTGRSLELDNLFMSQTILDNLYHKIKDIRYYPFNLNYQGHLLLDVGQWVTIKTNTGETFKSPILSQSFTFKGGLRGRISADSKAGNDAQYSYAGTITKKIVQFSEFEKQIQNQIEEADKGFGQKVEKIKNDFNDQVELAKARAEEVKRELSDTIDQRFNSFNNGPLQEAKRRADEALRNVGASSLLAQEAKQISERAKADIATLRQNISNDYVAKSQHVEDVRGLTRRFEEINLGSPNLIINGAAELGDKNWGGTNGKWFTNRTHGFYKNSSAPLFTIDTKEAGLCYIQTGRYNQLKKNTDYTLSFTGFMSRNVSGFRVLVGLLSNKDNVWKRTLGVFNQRLSPEQAERFTVQFNSGDYDGFSLRFDNFGSTDGQSATVWITEIDVYEGTLKRAYQPAPENNQNYADAKISEYRTTVDGRFANIASQIAGKANQTDFQRVQETSKLYERIIGRSESDIADKVARMALTNQLFQVEVAKASAGGRNLFLNSLFKRDLRDKYSTYKLFDDTSQTKGQLSVSIDSENQFRGVNTLKIVSTFNGKTDNQKITFSLGGNSRTGRVDELKNKSARFSFWAKSTVNNTNFQARAGYRNTVQGVLLTTDWKFYDIELIKKENSNATSELILHIFSNATVWIAFPKVEIGTESTPFSEAPEDIDEAIRTVQNQLTGSWAVQNLTSAGSIVSQINATNNQILIEAEKIRLKGKTLLDELTAIQGYFKRLFVGEGNFAKLNAEIIGSRTITADKLIMDQAMARMFVSSDIFTDTLAAKEAFINKLRSVVVSATLLEGYKGRIGGFQIGTHDKDPSTYWLTGQNQFYVGMSNGAGNWGKTALWVNWGTTWDAPGNYAWFVKESGEMFCYNRAYFWNTPVINGDLRVTGDIYYNNKNSGKSGYWIYSPQYKQIFSDNGYMYFVWSGGGSSWVPLNKEISDRRYKHNIEDSAVSALDVIENLKTYSYRKEYDGKIEDISCGIMAQDVQKYIPEAFYENPDGAYSYRTFELVPYLIKAIQELNQKIEKMEKIVA